MKSSIVQSIHLKRKLGIRLGLEKYFKIPIFFWVVKYPFFFWMVMLASDLEVCASSMFEILRMLI